MTQFLLFQNLFVSHGTDEFKPEECGLTEKLKRARQLLKASEGNGTGCNKTGMIESDRGFEPEEVAETRLLPKKIWVPNNKGNKLKA